MSSEEQTRLQIGHVLFIDIVGYSKLLVNEQSGLLRELNELVDVNQRQNIAGAGINMAQRVMDCGDAGHIFVSKHVAEDLEQHDRWRPLLHDLGSCEVKHGVRIEISNLYSDEVGNPQLPKKFQAL